MRKTIAFLASGAAATMIVGGVGLASASARPASARPASSAVSGTEHFSLMTTQPTAARYTIIATGVFTAGGTDISGNKTDLVKLPGGTFKVHHGGRFRIVKEQLNKQTCLAVFEARANLTIGGGTGKYKGISGSGTALISQTFIARRSHGACNPNLTPSVSEQTITAKAHVHL